MAFEVVSNKGETRQGEGRGVIFFFLDHKVVLMIIDKFTATYFGRKSLIPQF